MTDPLADPNAFARGWAAAWNARDLEAVLAHFHENAIFTSPLATRIDSESGGVLRGKDAIRRYWRAGLDLSPELHFDLTTLHAGVDCLLIGFRNELGQERVEVLRFREGRVVEGHGTFLVGD